MSQALLSRWWSSESIQRLAGDADEWKYSIVAFLGLGGRPYKTWTHPESDKLWLRDFLPAQMKGPVPRVMTIGYDADLCSRNVLDIRGFAESLLAGLQGRRR